jgi:hypothetical protein
MFYTQLADQILLYFLRLFDPTFYAVETYKLIDTLHAVGRQAFLQKIANPDAKGVIFTIQGALLGQH